MENRDLSKEIPDSETEKDPYLKKADALVREWAAEMEKLKAKADQAEAEARIEYQNDLDELSRKKAVVEKKLEAIRSSSEAAWKEIQSGVDQALSDLKSGIEQAAAKFR